MLSWREIPYFRIAIVFVGGILFGSYMASDTRLLLGIIVLLLIFYFLVDRKKYFAMRVSFQGLLILVLFFLLGSLRYAINDPRNHPHHIHRDSNQTLFVLGVITESSDRRSSIRYTMNSEYAGFDSLILQPRIGKLLVYVPLKDSARYEPGDRIIVYGRLQEIAKNTNPYVFDYRSYLANKKIYNQLFSKRHALVDRQNLIKPVQWATGLRRSAIKVLNKHLEDPAQLAIASAMILGYKNYISEDLYDAYTDSGAVHVLAVSGLHVGIVSGLLFFLFNLWQSNDWRLAYIKVFLIVLSIWIYVMITGAAPAAVRAGLMFTIWLIGKTFFETANVYNVISISAMILLLKDPYMLFQLGFQFSFIALLSLVYFFPIIKNLWIPRHKWLEKVWHLIAVSLAAQILIGPLTIYYFHKFPIYFILSGLVAVPMAGVILAFGLMLLCFEWIIPGLNLFVAPVLKWILGFFVKSIYWIQQLPKSTVDNIWLEDRHLVQIYLGTLFVICLIRYRQKLYIYLIVSLILISVVMNKNDHMDDSYSIHFYDQYRNTIIDFMDQSVCYSFLSSDVSIESSKFIYHNNRIRNGIQNVITIDPKQDISDEGFASKGGLFQLGNKLLAIVGNSPMTPESYATELDILVIDERLEGLENILANSHLDLVVISNTFSSDYQNSYKDLCLKYQIPCHVIKDQGALSIYYK